MLLCKCIIQRLPLEVPYLWQAMNGLQNDASRKWSHTVHHEKTKQKKQTKKTPQSQVESPSQMQNGSMNNEQ